jgi:hypothetical protein
MKAKKVKAKCIKNQLMKFVFIFFVFILPLTSIGQETSGIDTARNIRWETRMKSFYLHARIDSCGHRDSIIDIERLEYELNEPYTLDIVVCGTKESVFSFGMIVPNQFVYMEKLADDKEKFSRIGGKVEIRTKGGGPERDSISQVDNERFAEWLKSKKDSLRRDTIMVRRKQDFTEKLWCEYGGYLVSKCSYQSNLKSGYEYTFYRIDEVKGICISDHFMIKCKGHWKRGEKNGKWIEYDRAGKVTSIKKYRHGRLIE